MIRPSANCQNRLDVGQELSGQLGELLEVRKVLASQLIAKLHGKRVQFQQAPERFDILTSIFEQPDQQTQVMGSRVVNPLEGANQAFRDFSTAC